MIVIDPRHILIILDLAYIIIRNLSREVLAHFEQVFNFLCCFYCGSVLYYLCLLLII